MPTCSFTLLLLAFSALCSMPTQAQADGNPHGWSRERRCDQWPAYDPPCTACEGYGGIPYGDLPDEINMTTCEVVQDPVNPMLRIRPVWDVQHFTEGQYGMLIGGKKDPNCQIILPTPSSAGPLCYTALSKSNISYDMLPGGPRARRSDKLSEDGSTKFSIHQGLDIWSVKHATDGSSSCSCIAQDVWPIQYNFTQQLLYQGRVKLGIEIPETSPVEHELKEVDHWSFGPHHFWTIPQTGVMVRSYQPYNGLQIWGETRSTVDPAQFAAIPPLECTKGMSARRVGCRDDGYPNASSVVTMKLEDMPKDTNTNTARAIQVVPRPEFRGDSFNNMSHTLNKWLRNSTRIRECDQFSSAELQELSALIHMSRDRNLDLLYSKADDNRRLRGNLADMQKTWARLNSIVEKHSDHEMLHRIQRDGHCHEVVMLFVHHLSEDVKEVLRETGVEMPLLSYNHHGPECKQQLDPASEEVCEHYKETVTCLSCHSDALPPAQ